MSIKNYKRKSKDMQLKFQYKLFEPQSVQQIGSIGFTILTYILLESRASNDSTISISFVMEFLDIKQHTIVRKYLKELQNLNIIQTDEGIDFDTVDKNKRIFISLENYYNESGGYRLIPARIFLDYYKYINPIAWLIFCTLAKLYHPDNKFAKASKINLLQMIDISSKRTLDKNIKLLEDLKLIEITEGKGYFNHSKSKLGSEPNHYVVKYLLDSN